MHVFWFVLQGSVSQSGLESEVLVKDAGGKRFVHLDIMCAWQAAEYNENRVTPAELKIKYQD